MDFQFNTANSITGDDDVRARIEATVRQKLSRISDSLTRVELHLGDEDGPVRDGAGKRATLEARPKGDKPFTVTHTATTVDLAAAGAADKCLSVFERLQGKRTDRKGH